MAKAEKKDGLVSARVLVACNHGAPNDVVQVTEEVAAAGLAAGELDPNPNAVAAALEAKPQI